jgi:hypothetical protein
LSNTGVEYWNEMGVVFSAKGRGLDDRDIEEMRLGKLGKKVVRGS